MKNERLLILGQKIRFERLKRGFSQEELAEKTDLSRRAISCIECGTNDAKFSTLVRLIDVLEVEPTYLFSTSL